jgi:hypothetical protein
VGYAAGSEAGENYHDFIQQELERLRPPSRSRATQASDWEGTFDLLGR